MGPTARLPSLAAAASQVLGPTASVRQARGASRSAVSVGADGLTAASSALLVTPNHQSLAAPASSALTGGLATPASGDGAGSPQRASEAAAAARLGGQGAATAGSASAGRPPALTGEVSASEVAEAAT